MRRIRVDAIVRIVDDEETVRNSELFIFKLAGIPAVAYSSAEEFLSRDDLSQAGCIIQFDLAGNHITELLSVLLLAYRKGEAIFRLSF